MKSGIYTITNQINGKIYIGCATDLYRRRYDHFESLRRGIHKNEVLQQAYNKYGEENLIYEVLVRCPKEFLASEEHYWANLLNVHHRDFGYNRRPTHPYGKVVNTEEMKQKMRLSHIGKKLSKETIEKRTRTRLENAKKRGYYHSEETKRKQGEKSFFKFAPEGFIAQLNRNRSKKKNI